MTMVILSTFLSLEGQTSYYVEGKPWPPHSSLLGDGGNGHAHTLPLLKPRRATSYSIEGRSLPPHNPHIGKWGGMAMVIFPLFFWLEGQTSCYVEDKQWPLRNSLLGDGGNGHGHTPSLLRPRRADFPFYRGQVMATLQPPYWKMEGDGYGHTPSLLLARRADFLLCR